MSEQKALRVSIYTSPEEFSIATVTENDVQDELQDLINEKYRESHGFIAHDVFTVSDDIQGDAPEVLFKAKKRIERCLKTEKNQAILYFYDAKKFAMLNDGGTLSATKPAPLTAEQIEDVLLQLSARPDYRDFTIQTPDKNGQMVVLSNGEIQ